MADAVATQTILDGPRNAVIKFTNLSDGTGEAAVVKVTPSSLSGSPTSVAVKSIKYNVQTMNVTLLWKATTDVRIFTLNGYDTIEFNPPLPNPKTTGWTGAIAFTTAGATAGSNYSIELELIKKY